MSKNICEAPRFSPQKSLIGVPPLSTLGFWGFPFPWLMWGVPWLLECLRSGVLLMDDPEGFEGLSDPFSPDSLLQGSMDPRGPPTPGSSSPLFRLPGFTQLCYRPSPLFPFQGSWGFPPLLSWGIPKTDVLTQPVLGDHHLDTQISPQRGSVTQLWGPARSKYPPKKPSPPSDPQSYLCLKSGIWKILTLPREQPLFSTP